MGCRKNVEPCDKKKHKTHEHAVIHSKKFGKADVLPYLCDKCGYFHIGHTKEDSFVQQRMDDIFSEKDEFLKKRKHAKRLFSQIINKCNIMALPNIDESLRLQFIEEIVTLCQEGEKSL